MKKIIFLLFLSITSIGYAQSIYKNTIEVKHTYYTNYFNTDFKEEILGKYVQTIQNSKVDVDKTQGVDRSDVATFKEDPLISEDLQISTNDFYKSYNSQHKFDDKGVDKGHINPYSAFAFNIVAAKESMYIQNTDPQYSYFNRHQWEQVEQYVIKQVSLSRNIDNITVYTGALIKFTSTIITDGKGHSLYVPDYYWKVIVYNVNGKTTYEAWLGKNTPDNKDTNPDDIKFDVSVVKKEILSYYPNMKLEF